ncbi:metal ABC transporter substrate-binding protein [Nocardioides sp. GCM10027113]|uniref:metal ABC transporter substrate-binding protein n=1 Tax=unclassified Nocardioides TaxID=2615069 RepID=UPI003605B2B2
MLFRSTPGRRMAALALTLPLVATGCGALTGDAGETEGGVVAAFYPLAFVAERVAGEHVPVSNLTAVGGEPHDLELTVEETARLAGAGLVIHQQGFQPAVDDAVEQNVEGDVLDVTDVVDLRPATDHSEEGHADEEHADHADDEEHEHEHGDTDPHFWLDPLRMADVADAVADRLADLDPDHAEEFAQNAAALRADLEALHTEYADGLASCERDTVVVNHDAFGYLAEYGLHLEPIVGLSPDAEPTPADLARLQRLIRDEGITTVFAERLDSPQAAEALAGDLGIDVEVLDPVEGLTTETQGDDYLSLMRANLELIREANGC